MHYVYLHARRDLAKTWVMGHFQITLDEIETTMMDWEPSWRKDLPIEDIVDSDVEEEETSADKKENADDEEEEHANEDMGEEVVGKEEAKPVIKKTWTQQSKKDTTKKNETTETEADLDALDQETINVLSKRKLPLGGLGSTPKKAWGSPAQFP